MMKLFKINIAVLLLVGIGIKTTAQEIQAKVNVIASRVGPGIEKKIFTTLQNSLTNFINNRKWSDQTFAANEKIECNFTINVTEVVDGSTFKATLAVQAARPIFNTSYKSPLINFVDEKFIFKYVEFQAIDFNDNRVQGNDALVANLPATLAYYIYMVLGFDFDSFELKSGDPYFQKAQNIVNNAPDNRSIEGWKAFDGQRNRYWLSENLTNSRYSLIHDIIYNYYRKAMDFMYENEAKTRQEMTNCLVLLNSLKKENTSNSNMVVPFFVQSKSQEWINVFKKATPPEKSAALEILKELDITNANKYKDELK
jgi:Domain of unknown function (DUF4835)